MNTQVKIAHGGPYEAVPMKPEDILTPDQLAEHLQVNRSWVYEKRRRRGKYIEAPMPCLRIGRYLRFYWPDICEWMRNMANRQEKSPRR
jgi:predicted DNA-binding transcriptional regulator AlpA